MSEDVQTLNTHERIVETVFRDSLLKAIGSEDRFSPGHTTITLTVNTELPEYTPEVFNPCNDLECYLIENKQSSTLKQTVDFAAHRYQFYKALSIYSSNIQDLYNCEIMVMCTQPMTDGDSFSIRLELMSKALNRTLYIDIVSHIGE